MMISCTEAGKALGMNKEEVKELIGKEVFGNYGSDHRSMIHEDELRGYVQLLNGEISNEEFEELKKQIKLNNIPSAEVLKFDSTRRRKIKEYQVTEEQYKALQKIVQMKDTLDYLMMQDFGYVSVKELIGAYRNDNVSIVNEEVESNDHN